jgi:hypothetical protein
LQHHPTLVGPVHDPRQFAADLFAPAPLAALRLHPGSVLTRTLTANAGLDGLTARVRSYVERLAPALAAPGTLDRIERRIRFAGRRASITASSPLLRAGQAALLFATLRPFDLWPTLVYRIVRPYFARRSLRPPTSA